MRGSPSTCCSTKIVKNTVLGWRASPSSNKLFLIKLLFQSFEQYMYMHEGKQFPSKMETV